MAEGDETWASLFPNDEFRIQQETCLLSLKTREMTDMARSAQLVSRQNEDVDKEFKERRRKSTAEWMLKEKTLTSQDLLLDDHVV